MARGHVRASVEYLWTSNPPIVAAPFSVAGFFYVDDITQGHDIITFTQNGTNDEGFRLRASGSESGDLLKFVARAGGSENSAQAKSSIAYPASEWFHAGGKEISSSSRKVYLNGGNTGTNGALKTPAGLDRFTIGAFLGSSVVNPLDGKSAEVAVWNVALDDEEFAALALGYSPLLIRRASLVWYSGLIRDEDRDIISGQALSVGGTPTIEAHPPIIQARSTRTIFVPTVVAGGAILPQMMRNNLGAQLFNGTIQ